MEDRTVEVLAWMRTSSDRLDEASTVISVEWPQKNIVRIVSWLEDESYDDTNLTDQECVQIEQEASELKAALEESRPGETLEFIRGHGITIIYASGHRRHIRSLDFVS